MIFLIALFFMFTQFFSVEGSSSVAKEAARQQATRRATMASTPVAAVSTLKPVPAPAAAANVLSLIAEAHKMHRQAKTTQRQALISPARHERSAPSFATMDTTHSIDLTKETSQEIIDASKAIQDLSFVLRVANSLLSEEVEVYLDLYSKLNEMVKPIGDTSGDDFYHMDLPLTLYDAKPEEIIAHYISKCYEPICKNYIHPWYDYFTGNPAYLRIKDNVPQPQASEILLSLEKQLKIYKDLLENSPRPKSANKVYLDYFRATRSIQTWIDLTAKAIKPLTAVKPDQIVSKIESDLRDDAKLVESEFAKLAEQITTKASTATPAAAVSETPVTASARAADQTTMGHSKLKKVPFADDSTTAAPTASAAPVPGAAAPKSILKVTVTPVAADASLSPEETMKLQLKSNGEALLKMKDTVKLADASLSRIDGYLNLVLAELHQSTGASNGVIIKNLRNAYSLLQVKRDIDEERKQDEELGHTSYDDSFLHLRSQFQKDVEIIKQTNFVLEKAIYAWTLLAFMKHGGNLNTKVTLLLGSNDKPEKTIKDWINFTKRAGADHGGQFAKILKDGPPKTWSETAANLGKTLRGRITDQASLTKNKFSHLKKQIQSQGEILAYLMKQLSTTDDAVKQEEDAALDAEIAALEAGGKSSALSSKSMGQIPAGWTRRKSAAKPAAATPSMESVD